MTRAVAPVAIPSDPGLPGVRGLFAEDGSTTVRSFLAARGWDADEVRPVQATYRPGRSCIVRYRAAADGPQGRRSLTLCIEQRARRRRHAPPPEDFESRFGIADPVQEVDGRLVWAYPYDPTLRDLPDAAWGPSVRSRLAATGARAAAVAVQPLRYRPRRRAVFRYRTLDRLHDRRWTTRFGKVIPSEKVRRAEALRPAFERAGLPVAVADVLGRQMVVTDELEGRCLRDLLIAGGSLPSPSRVAALPTRLAHELCGAEVTWQRPPALDVATASGALVTTLLPDLAGDVERITDAVAEGAGDLAPSLVHGDLYEAQILVGRNWSLGLIDLDDVSIGDAAMDAANFCAHLLALALSVPAAAGRLVAYRQLVRPALIDALGIGEAALAWREALCMLQLSTGPFRVLDPRWPGEVRRRVHLAVRLLQGG